jgi:Secretion system C-terminal sorting domain
LTEINLCGTIVNSLNCGVNHNLVYLSVKNNVISEIYLADGESDSELPQTSFMLYDLPLLETICYDEGELPAIQFSQNSQNISLFTDCVLNCSTLKTENPISVENFKIYPNPAKNSLNINAKQAIAIQSITIYNPLGQLIQMVSNQEFDKTITIDVSQLKTGTYFVTILSDKGKTVEKFMKL